MKVLDLFSGIGMFSFGLEKSGMETIAFCEKDNFKRKILRQHWPNVMLINDIKNLDGSKFNGLIDVVCGGYPCVGHSPAGKKKGFENELSSLWEEYFRIIEEVRPTYAIIENSANIRTTGLARLLKDINSIFYHAEGHIIPSCAVGGISRRERMYIVAHCNKNFRLFTETFTTKKEKSEWWAMQRSSISSKWANKPEPCRIYSGYTGKLDAAERERRNRIGACGDSLDWRIPYIIGKMIMKREQEK